MQWAIIPEIGQYSLYIDVSPIRSFFNNIFNHMYTYMYESYLMVSDLTIFNVNLWLFDGLLIERTGSKY